MQTAETGVRRLSPGAFAARRRRVPDGEIAPRKELVIAAREAAVALNLRPSVRQVLGELVGCYGEQGLARGLMVWPSNDYLCRKTGLGERTIRSCIAELVRSELIDPVDSANRKRFAIRAPDGTIIDAYGFNLAPIYARRLEFAGMLIQQKQQREAQGRLFDEITICRKACEELIRALSGLSLDTPLRDFQERFGFLMKATPARRTMAPIEGLVTSWQNFRSDLEAAYELHYMQQESGYAGNNSRHKEQNNGQSSDPCNGTCGENAGTATPKPVPIGLLSEACPALLAYNPSIRSDADAINAGRYLRSSIGAHPTAWDEAVEKLGMRTAAILVIYVLQLHEDDVNSGKNRIANPGGLFRSLTRRLELRDFDLNAELHALRRRHMG